MRFVESRKITAVLLISLVCIWFTLGRIIDTTEVCILIPVLVASTFTEGHKDARKQNILHQLSLNVCLDGIWYAVEAC